MVFHALNFGAGRMRIFSKDQDYLAFEEPVEKTLQLCPMRILAHCLMTNHFHLFFRTPQANLSRGMQFLLSGYAAWWNSRHACTGHVFQGRFRGHLVEDETYY